MGGKGTDPRAPPVMMAVLPAREKEGRVGVAVGWSGISCISGARWRMLGSMRANSPPLLLTLVMVRTAVVVRIPRDGFGKRRRARDNIVAVEGEVEVEVED